MWGDLIDTFEIINGISYDGWYFFVSSQTKS